ncbi:MAG: type IV pilus secretin PilQ [Omnitrophica bacterium]|nr:type IV pilus secretin PilQ [Candidatus Omnitrophota bacterium]
MRKTIFLMVLFSFTLLLFAMPGVAEELPKELPEQPEKLPAEKSSLGLVTMDFEDADMRDVIKVITMASGMNMVIGKDVEAKVTISLKDMPWEKALDVILRTYNFTYKKEENLIRIMTFEKVKQEERDIPLTTKIVYLNFANVNELKGTLAKMLSDRGTIEVDARTNSMLITDLPTKIEEAEKIAKELDSQTPQVLIEAMLVDVKLTKDNELGINWNIVQAETSLDQDGAGDTYVDYIRIPSAINTASAAIQSGWTQRLGQYGIDGLIKAWMQDAKANILASPKIVTLDNQTAKIEIKSQVAYTQVTASDTGGGGSSSTTQFKDVVTGLEVTPHITKEGFILMNVKPRQEFVEAMIGGQPQIGSRSAETNVLVRDGETIVIGGLRKVEDNATYVKVPFLGDIPILGHFFRQKDVQRINTELVMFVTPHIIAQPVLSDEEKDRYEMLDRARESFLKDWEKEKKKLKKSKRQAKLFKEEVTEYIPAPGCPAPGCAKAKIEQLPPLPEIKDYIYSW